MVQVHDDLIRVLVERLSDESPVARRNAAGALRLHGRRAVVAVQALTKLLGDRDIAVQVEARRALECLRSEAA